MLPRGDWMSHPFDVLQLSYDASKEDLPHLAMIQRRLLQHTRGATEG